MKGTPTTWLHTAFQLVLGLKKMSTPTQCSLSQFWSPNSKKYDFEITSLSPQEKMAHKWSKWLKNTLRVYIASEWLVFYFSFSSLYFSDRSKIGLKLDNVPLCETQTKEIGRWTWTSEKYSPLKNTHTWKIYTRRWQYRRIEELALEGGARGQWQYRRIISACINGILF